MTGAPIAVDPPDPSRPHPKLSVLLTTYNHERFIGRSLDAILGQRTSFPFEVVVGEDRSTDRTREIVLDYRRRHPGRIRLVLPERNLGPNGMYAATLDAVRGEQIAMCDGDDQWTSPDKLARQSAFLDANPRYDMCFHGCTVVFDDGRPPRPPVHPPQRTFAFKDLAFGNVIAASSVVMRHFTRADIPAGLWETRFTDWATWLMSTRRGPAAYLDDLSCVYRVHAGGLWGGRGREDQLLDALSVFEALERHLDGPHRDLVRDGMARCRLQLAVERCGAPYDRPVVTIGPSPVPWDLNGRPVVPVAGDADEIIEAIEERRHAGHGGGSPTWRPQTPVDETGGLFVVTPAAAADDVVGWTELLRHLDAYPCVWRGDAGTVHRLPEPAPEAALHVVEVRSFAPADLLGGHVDVPKAGQMLPGRAIPVAGWALGRDRRVLGVTLETGGAAREARTGVARPDLSEAFPGVPGADRGGFRGRIPFDGAPVVRVVAQLESGASVPIGEIHVRSAGGG
jgi:hypothetical protein